jgi:hypothetical protein
MTASYRGVSAKAGAAAGGGSEGTWLIGDPINFTIEPGVYWIVFGTVTDWITFSGLFIFERLSVASEIGWVLGIEAGSGRMVGAGDEHVLIMHRFTL